MGQNTYLECRHCNQKIIHQALKRHQGKCPLSKRNARKIINFLLTDPNAINIGYFTEWARPNNILAPGVMQNRFKMRCWKDTILILCLLYYRKGFVDLEEIDLTVFKNLTWGTYFYSNKKLTQINNKIKEDEPGSLEYKLRVEEEVERGYEHLLLSVVGQAAFDVMYTSDDFFDKTETQDELTYDENGGKFTRQHAEGFLADFCPEYEGIVRE